MRRQHTAGLRPGSCAGQGVRQQRPEYLPAGYKTSTAAKWAGSRRNSSTGVTSRPAARDAGAAGKVLTSKTGREQGKIPVKTAYIKCNTRPAQNSIEKTVFQAILGGFSGKLLKGERILQQTGETPRQKGADGARSFQKFQILTGPNGRKALDGFDIIRLAVRKQDC